MLSWIDRIILLLGQLGAPVVGGAMWLTFECWSLGDVDAGLGEYWECIVGDSSGDLVNDYHLSGFGKE